MISGNFVRPTDRFVALDLFGRTDLLDPSADRAEVQRYASLSRGAFERNYLALHDGLPEVVEGLSSSIVDLVIPGSTRFIHIDAPHLHDQVAVDVRATRTLPRAGGVAVFTDGLIPIAITPYKFSGV